MIIDVLVCGVAAYIGITTAQRVPHSMKFVYVGLWIASAIAGAIAAEYHYGVHATEWAAIAACFLAGALVIYVWASLGRRGGTG